jgi:hypothetical protein
LFLPPLTLMRHPLTALNSPYKLLLLDAHLVSSSLQPRHSRKNPESWLNGSRPLSQRTSSQCPLLRFQCAHRRGPIHLGSLQCLNLGHKPLLFRTVRSLLHHRPTPHNGQFTLQNSLIRRLHRR